MGEGNSDSVGDPLREFYAAFGMAGEGPPPGINVSAMLPASAFPTADVQLMRGALLDHTLRRQHVDCRQVLDDLATRLTGDALLQELSGLPAPTDERFNELSAGVFWFALASSLDRRQDGVPVTPLDDRLGLPLPLKVKFSVEGSLVLRLYVALVYMREGALNDLIAEGARAGQPCCGRVRKLLQCDYLRRLRNALAHGTFSSCIAGIAFRDDDGVVVATPGFLNWLCTWLMLIQLQVVTAGSRRRGDGG